METGVAKDFESVAPTGRFGSPPFALRETALGLQVVPVQAPSALTNEETAVIDNVTDKILTNYRENGDVMRILPYRVEIDLKFLVFERIPIYEMTLRQKLSGFKIDIQKTNNRVCGCDSILGERGTAFLCCCCCCFMWWPLCYLVEKQCVDDYYVVTAQPK